MKKELSGLLFFQEIIQAEISSQTTKVKHILHS